MFPPEIVDLFIESLVEQGGDLVPALSVSRTFNLAAKRHIFRHIDLIYFVARNAKVNHRSGLLHDLLKANPTLVQRIQSLSITLCDDPDRMTRGPYLGRLPTLWDANFPAVLRVLAASPITTLRLIGESNTTNLWFIQRDISILEGLLALRSCPTLRTLHIQNVGAIPLGLLTGMDAENSVTHLIMHWYSAYNDPAARAYQYPFTDHNLSPLLLSAISPPHPPNALPLLPDLRRLDLPHPSNFFAVFGRHTNLQLPSLLTLTASNQHEQSDSRFTRDYEALSVIFQQAPQLENFDLEDDFTSRLHFPRNSLEPAIRFSSLRTLRNLTFRRTLGTIDILNDSLQTMANMIDEGLPSLQTLETLTLVFNWPSFEPETDATFHQLDTGWLGLRVVLRKPPLFRDLTISFSTTRRPGKDIYVDYNGFNALAAEMSSNGRWKVKHSFVIGDWVVPQRTQY